MDRADYRRIDRVGQEYSDDPVYLKPKKLSGIERALSVAFKRTPSLPLLARYDRVRLQWMKPDGNGGLRPVNNTSDSNHEDYYLAVGD